MAKRNLLDIVIEILNDIDGDFVNSISDTDESEQVANIVKSTYQAMMSNRNWPHTAKLVSLVPYADSDRPTHMSINEDIKEMISIYYDKRQASETRLNYQMMKYRDPDDFLRYINSRNSDALNVDLVLDPSGVKLLIQNDKGPEYYTSFDDKTLVFDSYDGDVDSTLQSSKVQARAYVIPDFSIEDDFIPDLPDEAFTALIEEAKSKAALKVAYKQDIKAEQESGRQNRWLSRKSWRAHEKDIYPYNYGRGRHGGHGRRKDPTFRRD